jgi:hypothetical protein
MVCKVRFDAVHVVEGLQLQVLIISEYEDKVRLRLSQALGGGSGFPRAKQHRKANRRPHLFRIEY